MAIKGGENAICGMWHTERPSGHRPRSLMRTTCRVRRAPALELAPTILFLDTTRGTTISRGDLGGRCDYPALPVRQSGSSGMRRRIWGDHWPGQALKTWWHGPPRPTKPLSILIPLKTEKLVPLQSYGAYAVRAVGQEMRRDGGTCS